MELFLEPDPSEKKRKREVKLKASYYTAAPRPQMAEEIEEFVAVWCSRVPDPYGRALATAFGQNLSLRAAAERFGLDHRRLSEYRNYLRRELKEVL